MKRDTDATEPQRNCHECHFLTTSGPFRGPFEDTIPLSPEDRHKIAKGSFFRTFNFAENCVYCARQVWLIEKDSEGAEKAKQAIFKKRDDNCFYFPHSPGMSCETAKELEHRNNAMRYWKRGIAWGIIGAIIGAIITVIFA